MLGAPVTENLIKPKLRSDLIPFFEAFNVLTKDRPIGEVIGYIPYSSILAYANENQFKGILRLELFHIIDLIDNAYVKNVNDG